MSEVKRYRSEICGIGYKDVVLASDYDALRLQLSRAKEWMQHDADCEGVLDPRSVECTCGLTEFLKGVGE